MTAKISVLDQTHGLRLSVKFRLDRFILSPSGVEKPQFLSFFGLRHLLVSPIGSSLRKLNTGAQLQTFPYLTALKLFLNTPTPSWRNREHNSDVQKRGDRQTDRQKKLNVFGRPGGG